MKQIETRSTRSTAEGAGAKFEKSQSLRLNKQIIRTLTGEDLKLVAGGGDCCCASCTCHSHQAL